ncbi:MAG: hypothetical protein AAB624_03050 [Patescibacteria group bacterium]
MTYGQIIEFIRALIAAGLDTEGVGAVLRSPDTAKRWVSALVSLSLIPDLGIFSHPTDQLRKAREAYGNFYSESQYQKALDQIPSLEQPDGSLQAWVLYGTVNTTAGTFDFLLQRLRENFPDMFRDSRVLSLPMGAFLTGPEFRSNTLQWVLIDFGAEIGNDPREVYRRKAASLELLSAAWLHPGFLPSLGKTIHGIFIPEHVFAPAINGWGDQCVLYLSGGKGRAAISVSDPAHSYRSGPKWGSPMVLKRKN